MICPVAEQAITKTFDAGMVDSHGSGGSYIRVQMCQWEKGLLVQDRLIGEMRGPLGKVLRLRRQVVIYHDMQTCPRNREDRDLARFN